MAYALVKDYVRSLGGELKWIPGGPGGAGDWRLELGGRVAVVPYREKHWCELDLLKKPKVKNPQTSEDYELELRPDAIWQLVEVFNRKGMPPHGYKA